MYRLLLSLFLVFTTVFSVDAQSEVKMGSHVLHQEGTNENSYKNGPYDYEKVEDINGVSKTDMFNRIKSWVASSVKVSNDNVTYDQSNDMIALNTGVPIKDFGFDITRQVVSFKLVFNFKDGKMRVKASDITYYGLDGTGAVFQKQFNDLRPIRKKLQHQIYEQFDANFQALVASALSGAKGVNNDKW